jgi:hypothetical protein
MRHANPAVALRCERATSRFDTRHIGHCLSYIQTLRVIKGVPNDLLQLRVPLAVHLAPGIASTSITSTASPGKMLKCG